MPIFNFKPNTKDTIVVNNLVNTASEGDFSIETTKDNLIVTVFKNQPNEGKRHYLNLNAVIIVNGDNVKLFGDLLLQKNGNSYDVIYNLKYIDEYTPPTALCQQSIKYNNLQNNATIYSDNGIHLMCECEGVVYVKDIAYPVTSPVIQFKPTGLGLLIVATAISDDKKYFCVILYNGNYRLLYEILADEMEFNTNSFIIKNKLKDMLGREKREYFTFKNGCFEPINSEFVLTHNIPYQDSLLPCLFLEALQAGDSEMAKGYLAEDLDNLDALTQFLGGYNDFDVVESDTIPDTYILKNNGIENGIYEPKQFKFEILNKKITNIIEA